MIEQYIMDLNEAYKWLPGEALIPIIFCALGFMYGLYRYIRSFKYIYYWYIENGEVIWNMEGGRRRGAMDEIAKKHKLPHSGYFTPHGYVSGLGVICLCTAIGTVIGTLWPLSLAVGVLTIPNFVLRRVAREKRNKAIFEQELKGDT